MFNKYKRLFYWQGIILYSISAFCGCKGNRKNNEDPTNNTNQQQQNNGLNSNNYQSKNGNNDIKPQDNDNNIQNQFQPSNNILLSPIVVNGVPGPQDNDNQQASSNISLSPIVVNGVPGPPDNNTRQQTPTGQEINKMLVDSASFIVRNSVSNLALINNLNEIKRKWEEIGRVLQENKNVITYNSVLTLADIIGAFKTDLECNILASSLTEEIKPPLYKQLDDKAVVKNKEKGYTVENVAATCESIAQLLEDKTFIDIIIKI